MSTLSAPPPHTGAAAERHAEHDGGATCGHRLRVRAARSTRDWQAAARILRRHAAWVEGVAGVPMVDAQPAFADELADLSATYGSDRSVLLVAEDATGIAGIVALRHHHDGTAELKRMFVLPTARGRGHAGRLVAEAVRQAERWGARRLWLETLPGAMDPAIALYSRHGFRHAGRAPHVGIDDAIMMVRDLERAAP